MVKRKPPTRIKTPPAYTTLCPDCHRLIYATFTPDGHVEHRIANKFITRDQMPAFHAAGFTLYHLTPDGVDTIITPQAPLPTRLKRSAIYYLPHLCEWDTLPKTKDGIPLIIFTYPARIHGLTQEAAQQAIDYLNRPPY